MDEERDFEKAEAALENMETELEAFENGEFRRTMTAKRKYRKKTIRTKMKNPTKKQPVGNRLRNRSRKKHSRSRR